MGNFAPMAEAKGSSIKKTVLAPAFFAASLTAVLSTSVTPHGIPIITLGIFPNPTSGVVYLSLSTQNAGGLLVNISDLNGNQVMHSNFSANEGANSFKIDLSALNSGAYFINITYENGVTIKNDKLILMGQ